MPTTHVLSDNVTPISVHPTIYAALHAAEYGTDAAHARCSAAVSDDAWHVPSQQLHDTTSPDASFCNDPRITTA